MENDDNKNSQIINNLKFNFEVDLNHGIFSETFKTINNNLFSNDFTNIIKKTENKIQKELYVLIRKNQHFLKKINLNNKNIFDSTNLKNSFTEPVDFYCENLSKNIIKIFTLENQDILDFFSSFENNSLDLSIFILPKFKKNEINFSFSNDLIELSFKINQIERLYCEILSNLNNFQNENLKENKNFEKFENLFEIELVNLNQVNKTEGNENNFPLDLYKLIKKEIKKIFVNHLINFENIFLVINKFLSHIENYFPVIFNKCYEERINNIKMKNENFEENNNKKSLINWSQNEQEKLEEALKLYKDEKDTRTKFKKISEFLKTKSPKECVDRYKHIVNLYKKEEKKQDLKTLETEKIILNEEIIPNKFELKIKERIVEPKKPVLILDEIKDKILPKEKVILKPEIKTKEILIEIPEIKTKPIETNSKTNNKNTPSPVDNLHNLDMVDLVDQLLNHFDMNYLNPNENIIEDPQIQKKNETNLPVENNLQNNNMEEQSSDEENSDYLENNNKDCNIYSSAVAKFDKFLNFTFNYKISSNHMNTILNVIKYGEKFAIQYSSVKLNQIALAEICDVNFFIKCKKCKMITFETKFIKISNKINLFYCATICPRCKYNIQIIFKSELIHIGNLQIAGISYSFGAIICDFLTSSFMINCLNCMDYNKKVKFRCGELAHKDRFCLQCQNEMNISTLNIQIVPYSSNNYSFLEDLEINVFKTNTQILENQELNEYVKLYEKKMSLGNPLPDNGTCKHYHMSFKWFRFDCCCKYFPCDECHNDLSNHEAEWAKNILCGYCCFEQSSTNKICCSCGKGFSKEAGANGFWEGGKGCRNKAAMSSKDSHKFKNSDNKTISRKKMKDIKEK